MAKALKVGVRAGAGPQPGYRWNVHFLTVAREEAMRFLTEVQYAHAADLVRALASEEDPTHPVTVSVDAVEDFFELRDKGGVLGKVNLRVFFIVNDKEKTIVVLAAIKKEAEGPTPPWAKIRVKSRLRKLRDGDFGRLA